MNPEPAGYLGRCFDCADPFDNTTPVVPIHDPNIGHAVVCLVCADERSEA